MLKKVLTPGCCRMIRLALFLTLAMAPAIPSYGMTTIETVPGVLITRGPPVPPEPAWRAARREAYVNRVVNCAPVIVPVPVRFEPSVYAW